MSVFGDGCISTHADSVPHTLPISGGDWHLPPCAADSCDFGLLGEQSSPKREIPRLGRWQTTVQNLTPLALSTLKKSVTVQTHKQTNKQKTVNNISTPCLSAGVHIMHTCQLCPVNWLKFNSTQNDWTLNPASSVGTATPSVARLATVQVQRLWSKAFVGGLDTNTVSVGWEATRRSGRFSSDAHCVHCQAK